MDADVIIFATCFVGNPRDQVTSIVGPELEEQLEDMWQRDKEGDIRGCGNPSDVSHLVSAPVLTSLTQLVYGSWNLVRCWWHKQDEVQFAVFGAANNSRPCRHTATCVL